jgi:hypothetical protein
MTITKERESRYLSPMQMAGLIDGAAFADWRGTPFTRLLSFNLKLLPSRPQDFITSFTKLAGDWLRSKGCPRAYEWVLEHPPTKSLNLHLLTAIPYEHMGSFARKERRWMREAGYVWRAGRLVSEILANPSNKSKGPQSPGELLCNTEGALGYMMKGGDPEACDVLMIEAEWQGLIRGKRCGVSQSISQGARDAAGYKPPKNMRESLLFRWRYQLPA